MHVIAAASGDAIGHSPSLDRVSRVLKFTNYKCVYLDIAKPELTLFLLGVS
jgi:hypothetical protein